MDRRDPRGGLCGASINLFLSSSLFIIAEEEERNVGRVEVSFGRRQWSGGEGSW